MLFFFTGMHIHKRAKRFWVFPVGKKKKKCIARQVFSLDCPGAGWSLDFFVQFFFVA